MASLKDMKSWRDRLSVTFSPARPYRSGVSGSGKSFLERERDRCPADRISCTPIMIKETRNVAGLDRARAEARCHQFQNTVEPATWQVPISFSAGLPKTEDVAA